MVAGFWYNQDGLPLQYGTQKAIPEVGGDYLMYGENREVEFYVALVPTQFGNAMPQIPAAPTSFLGTGTPIQAGIQSLTTLMPLQLTAPNTGGTSITFTATQIFIEQVETEVLIAATGGTSLSIGLVTTSPGSPSSSFVQVTPNGPNTHILNGQLIAQQNTVGFRTTYNQPGTHGFTWGNGTPGTLVAGGGDWVGINMPLVTNAITPLPTAAWFSAIASGTYTNGLIKVRVKYSLYGDISY